MKRIIAIIAFATLVAVSAIAQPKAVGIRGIGYGAFEASYEHTIGPGFIEANLGFDYLGGYGFKASALYNYMIVQPSWTSRGTWGIYAGGGLSMGYVYSYDKSRKIAIGEDGDYSYTYHSGMGTEISIPLQAGLEYTFWFPLQLSVDIRPYIGMHILRKDNYYVQGGEKRAGFYTPGLWGFLPTISVRYAF